MSGGGTETPVGCEAARVAAAAAAAEEGLSGVRGLAGAPHYQGYGVAGLSPGGPSAAPPTRRRPLTGAEPQVEPRRPRVCGRLGGGDPGPGVPLFSAPGASQQRQTDPALCFLVEAPVLKVYINRFILLKFAFVLDVLFVGFVHVNLMLPHCIHLNSLLSSIHVVY